MMNRRTFFRNFTTGFVFGLLGFKLWRYLDDEPEYLDDWNLPSDWEEYGSNTIENGEPQEPDMVVQHHELITPNPVTGQKYKISFMTTCRPGDEVEAVIIDGSIRLRPAGSVDGIFMKI